MGKATLSTARSIHAEWYYPQPGISSTLADATPSYPGFDAFNRIVDLPWTKSATGDLAQLQYGYDRVGNRTFRRDVKADGNFDERYAYDGLHRLVNFQRE